MRPTHRFSARVRSYEVDPLGRIQTPILCKLLQEGATVHAAELGVSVESLIKRGVAWVLTRLRLKMERWPMSGEEVVIITWPEALNRLTTERRFEIRGADDEVLGTAATIWVVLDLERRRPVRVPPFVVEALIRHDLGDCPFRPVDLQHLGDSDHEALFTVRRSDLDAAGHVNNTSYVEWALEAVPDGLWSRRELVELEISFLSECRRGAAVVSACTVTEGEGFNEITHELARDDDGVIAARARTVWRKPATGTT